MDNSASTVRYDIEVSADLCCFKGHFEGDPILPGIFQARNLVFHKAREAWPTLGRITRISRLKFRRPIRPKERLNVYLKREGKRVLFEICSADQVCSSGCLWFE